MHETHFTRYLTAFGVGRIFVHVDHSWHGRMRGSKRLEKELRGGVRIPCGVEEEIECVSF